MNLLQIVAMVTTLAVQSAAVGLLFAWRSKHDPTLHNSARQWIRADKVVQALLWVAVACIGGGVIATGCLAYGAVTEAA